MKKMKAAPRRRTAPTFTLCAGGATYSVRWLQTNVVVRRLRHGELAHRMGGSPARAHADGQAPRAQPPPVSVHDPPGGQGRRARREPPRTPHRGSRRSTGSAALRRPPEVPGLVDQKGHISRASAGPTKSSSAAAARASSGCRCRKRGGGGRRLSLARSRTHVRTPRYCDTQHKSQVQLRSA